MKNPNVILKIEEMEVRVPASDFTKKKEEGIEKYYAEFTCFEMYPKHIISIDVHLIKIRK